MTIEFDANVVRLVVLASVWLALKIVSEVWVLGYSVYTAVRDREDKKKALKALENITVALRGDDSQKSQKYDS